MKKYYILLLAISFNVFSPLNLQAKKVRTLRFTSYNIQHGKGLDGKIDHNRLASILHEARTEVAAIQEVDSVTKRNGGVYALDEIGSKLKMYSTFAPAIDFQGGKYGVGILSKKAPLSVHRVALHGKEEPRVLLVAEFEHYVVGCTHLSLNEDDRLSSIPLIIEEAQRWKKPFFLLGDLNDTPDSSFYREMQKHFHFLNPSYDKTFPADAPEVCIDHVAIFKPTVTLESSLSSYRTWVGEETFSDHRPLHAKIGIFR